MELPAVISLRSHSFDFFPMKNHKKHPTVDPHFPITIAINPMVYPHSPMKILLFPFSHPHFSTGFSHEIPMETWPRNWIRQVAGSSAFQQLGAPLRARSRASGCVAAAGGGVTGVLGAAAEKSGRNLSEGG